jgi:hypothetical protein
VLGHERGDSIWHRGTSGAQVGHRRSQSIDQRIHIEQRLDLQAIQNEHRALLLSSTAGQ